jgi:hypothetical protein
MKKRFIPVIAGGLFLLPFFSVAQQSKDFIASVEGVSPEMGLLLRDINNSKQDVCGKGFSEPELRHIISADNSYYELLAKLTKNPHARETTEYQRKVKAIWGHCRESHIPETDRK